MNKSELLYSWWRGGRKVQVDVQEASRQSPAQDAFSAGRWIRRELDESAKNPEGWNLDVNALRGRRGFRLRVGEMRVIFERYDDACIIDVLRIAPRGQAYKG